MEPLSPWARIETALALLAVDPAGVRGLWLRARAGPLRDRITAALPRGARKLHPGVEDAALFGGVDLVATLAQGRVVAAQGLLAVPGMLMLAMAERCPPGLAGRLAQVLDAPGFALVALDEGAEADEGLPPALADRLGLFLDPGDLAWAETAEIRLDGEEVAAARARLADLTVPREALARLARAAAAMGIPSLRAPLLAAAVARAHAAWRGAAAVAEPDLQVAAELVLAHRARILPEEAAPPDQPPPPAPEPGDPGAQTKADPAPPEDILLDAARAALPADLLARLATLRQVRAGSGSGGTGAARKGNHRGRPLSPQPGRPQSGRRIDLVATLRAAAPWQALRRPEGAQAGRLSLAIRAADIRLKRYEETSDRVLIFAVDASGSSALARLAEAKGAVELLLAQAYARRDHVALIAFRKQAAELVLPPTRSLVQTKRRLAGLAGGGGTPLAAGLRLALTVALQARARGMTPTVALLTDGRGNVGLDGSPGRAQAEEDAQRIARALRASTVPALVIDIANRPQPALGALAQMMAAPYLALPRADAQKLSAVLSQALGG